MYAYPATDWFRGGAALLLPRCATGSERPLDDMKSICQQRSYFLCAQGSESLPSFPSTVERAPTTKTTKKSKKQNENSAPLFLFCVCRAARACRAPSSRTSSGSAAGSISRYARYGHAPPSHCAGFPAPLHGLVAALHAVTCVTCPSSPLPPCQANMQP